MPQFTAGAAERQWFSVVFLMGIKFAVMESCSGLIGCWCYPEGTRHMRTAAAVANVDVVQLG